jgi:hypothetical protein
MTTTFGKNYLAAILCAIAALMYGCATVQQAQRSIASALRPVPAAPTAKRVHQITQEELEQLTFGFADRYFTYIISATESIESKNPDAVQRRRAHQVRLVQVSAVFDIASNPDPFTRLLDLMLVVTLQSHKWIEEDQAERWFGDRAQPMIFASRKAREDIWEIAARTMTAEQLEVIDYLIWDWRRRNPGIEVVSYVRFDDFAAARGKSIIADVKSGGGLLAPVGEATKAVDEMRLLAERSFFYAKRLPFLINWQVRAAVDDVLTESEARAFLDAARTLAQLPQEIRRERDAFLNAFTREQPAFRSVMAQYRGAIGDTTTLVSALKSLTDTSQRTLDMVDRILTGINSHTFDVREYGGTIDKLVIALQEANRLATTTATFVEGVQPERFDGIAKGGSAQAQVFAATVIDHAFWRMVALIVVFFLMLALYRLFSTRVDRRARSE